MAEQILNQKENHNNQLNYSQELFNCICSYLENKKWKYTKDDVRGIIKTLFRGVVGNVNVDVTIFVLVNGNYATSYASIAQRVSINHFSEITELLCSINNKIERGAWVVNKNTLDLYFKRSVNCFSNCEKCYNIGNELFDLPLQMIQQYYKMIYDLDNGSLALKDISL